MTAKRDLNDLVKLDLLKRVGTIEKHVYYILNVNGPSNGSYDSVKFEGKINSRQDTQGINRKGDDNDK